MVSVNSAKSACPAGTVSRSQEMQVAVTFTLTSNYLQVSLSQQRLNTSITERWTGSFQKTYKKERHMKMQINHRVTSQERKRKGVVSRTRTAIWSAEDAFLSFLSSRIVQNKETLPKVLRRRRNSRNMKKSADPGL